MKAMLLSQLGPVRAGSDPLVWSDAPEPSLAVGEVLLRVLTCGVCHTELDEIEGRTPPPHLPVILGHQVVGVVEQAKNVAARIGQRVGVAWIYSACGKCKFCLSGNENLCPDFRATGRDANGGYAEYMKVRYEFANPIPDGLDDLEAAPLLCAGAVGYRALRLSG